MIPPVRLPSATSWAPVSVATSMMTSGASSVGPGQGVAQDEPALGVGVEHLDGLAAVRRRRRRTGRDAEPDGMFSAMGAYVVTLTARPSRAMAMVAAMTAAAPPMSDFIALHAERRLDGEAAGVEGDALADEREVLGGVGVAVGEPDAAAAARPSPGRRR